MESSLPLLGAIILGFIIVIYIVNKRLNEIASKQTDQTLLEWLKTMQVSIDNSSKTLNQTLHNSNQNITSVLQTNTKTLNERLDNAARVISAVQKNIGEMSEIGRSMKQLQEFLNSPKLRGNIGEQVLKTLLSQLLPKQSFHLQYAFNNGSIVDAAIKTEAGIIPIDSKFPMENFRKLSSSENDIDRKSAEKDFVSDVKKHIESISNKYIVTNEGTIDYALMYIPSESIYYEIVNNPSLYDFAAKKRVLPVSPVTFYAFLRAILMSFEGQKISKRAQEILHGIRAIQKEHEKVGENIDTLSKHISNSYNMVSQVLSGFNRLGQQIRTTNTLRNNSEKLLDD